MAEVELSCVNDVHFGLEMSNGVNPKTHLENMAKEEEEKQSLKEFLKEWAENAACDGVPQIVLRKSWVKRILWLLIVLGLTAYTIEEVYGVFDEFFTYPVNTNINYTYSNQLTFPAITLCNMNPIRKSMLSEAGTTFDDIFGSTNGTFPGRKKREIGPQEETAPSGSQQRGKEKMTFINQFKRQWATLSYPKRIQLGHQLPNFVVTCSLGGQSCNKFFTYSTGTFGNCFVFNSGLRNTTVQSISKTGPLFGLTMEIFLEESEYLPEVTEQTGARLHINHQKLMPFPENAGYNLAPGYLTTIGLKRVEISRLLGYESNCTKVTTAEAEGYSIYSKRFGVSYSREACHNTCYQRKVIEICRCGDADYLFDYSFFKSLLPDTVKSIKPCLSATEEACVSRVLKLYASNNITCDCPIPCSESDYQATVTISPWPSKLYEPTLRSSYSSLNRNDILNTTLSRNLLKVEIYYDTLNYQYIYESPKYTNLSLISDLGGQIGLWLGASLFLLLQVLELFIDVIIFGCGRLFKSGSRVSSR